MNINKEVKVGLLTTVALLILYLGFNFLKGKEIFAKTHTYYAIYSDAQGLTTSSKVMLNGCPIGRVSELTLMPDQSYSICVGLAIGKNINLTDQTVAKLASSNILGNKVIELMLKPGNLLHKGDTLQTALEQDFQALFKESTLPTLQDAKAISELTNRFMSNLVNNTDRINSIFADLASAAQQMRQTIHVNQKDVGIISKNVAEFTQALSDPAVGIRPLLGKMHDLSQEITRMQLGELAAKMNLILAPLADGALHNNLNQALISLDDLLIDLRRRPSRYVHFSIFGHRPKPSIGYARREPIAVQETK